MFFSVIIPTCNRNDLLAKCLAQLQPDVQTLQGVAYEIIVTDDSAGEGAAALIAEHFPLVQWAAGPRRGPAANRNNGARLAKGEWLVFLDDDVLPDNDLLESYQIATLCHSNMKVFEGYTYADRPRQKFNEESPINDSGGNLWSCNFCIQKYFFLQIGGFDENFPYPAMEDSDLNYRIQRLEKIVFVEKARVMHPWRTVKAFSGYRKWLQSNQYLLKKNNVKKNLSYRYSRLKIMIGNFLKYSKTLKKYSFKGIGFYFELIWFDILMIFK